MVDSFLKGLGLCFLGLFLWVIFSFAAAFSPSEYGPHVIMGLSFTLMIFGPVLFWIVFPLKERWYDKGKKKRFYAIIAPIGLIFLIFLGVAFLPPEVPPEVIVPPEVMSEDVIIESYSITLDDVTLDKLYLDNVNVSLRNEGNAPAEIDKIVLSSGKSKIEDTLVGSLNPGEEEIFFLPTYSPLERKLGVDEVKGTIIVVDEAGKTLAVENISIQVPVARVGDTIPEVEYTHNLSLNLLSWKESKIAVDGSYTFTAKSGMKFVILIFKFQNNWIRPQETPYIGPGEIATNKGYIYTMLDPVDFLLEEYKSRKATDEEIEALLRDSGGYEDLLPEESTVGRVVYEIPKDETPIEASVEDVCYIIKKT